jgi:hypothetical protein
VHGVVIKLAIVWLLSTFASAFVCCALIVVFDVRDLLGQILVIAWFAVLPILAVNAYADHYIRDRRRF